MGESDANINSSWRFSLRTKVVAGIVLLLVAELLVLYGLSRSILLDSFSDMERDEVRGSANRALNLLQEELNALSVMVAGWAERDATYDLVADRAPAYIDENLTETTFDTLGLNLMVYLDPDGELVYGRVYTPEALIPGFVLTPTILNTYLTFNPVLAGYAPEQSASYSSGVIVTPPGPMLIAFNPILRSDHSGPPRGMLIIGRLLDTERIASLNDVGGGSIEVHAIEAEDLPDEYRRVYDILVTQPDEPFIQPIHGNRDMAGYVLLKDIREQPVLIMRVTQPRTIYERGRDTVFFFLGSFLLSGIGLAILIGGAFDRAVLWRIGRLSALARRVAMTGDMSRRVTVTGRDELAALAGGFNWMLDAIDESHLQLARSQIRMQEIIASISDVIYTAELDAGGRIVRHQVVSPQIVELTGYPSSRLNENWEFWRDLILAEDRPQVEAYMRGFKQRKSDEVEYRLRRADGAIIWVRDSAHAQRDMDNGGITLYGVLSDITARREAELQRAQAEARLRRSEVNLSALIENAGEAIWLIDRDYRLVTANAVFFEHTQRIFDIKMEPGVCLVDVAPPDLWSVWREYYDLGLQGRRFSLEMRFSFGAVGPVDVEVRINPIFTEDEAITGVSVFARDITERKQQEVALKEVNASLEKRNRELTTLHDVGHMLTAQLDLVEIYHVLYHAVQEYVGRLLAFRVGLYDAEAQTLVCAFAVDGETWLESPDLPPLEVSEGVLAEMIARRQPYIVDVATAAWGADRCQEGLPIQGAGRAALYVPLISGDRVLGVFMACRHAVSAFEDIDLSLLVTLSNQAAAAMKNAQLFAAEHEQRAFAEALSDTIAVINRVLDPDEVLDRMLQNIQRVVPHDTASIMLIDDGMARIVRHKGFTERGLDDFVMTLRFPIEQLPKFRRMRDTRRAVCMPDTSGTKEWVRYPELDWIRSYIGAPIVWEGEMIGVLNLDSAQTGFFTETHALRLQAFADQAAVAIGNARLFAAEREQRMFADTLRNIAATINQTLDLDDVLDMILAYIQRVVPHDAADIMLIDGEMARVARSRGYAERGLEDWIQQRQTIVHRPMLLRVIDGDAPLIVPDVTSDPDWNDCLEMQWVRSFACAPIRHENRITGFLNVYSAESGFFTAAHAERLQAFAYQAANAIRNARLFETVQNYAGTLEMRVRERTRELDRQRAQLQAILDAIGEGVIYDERLETKYLNRALTHMTGYAPHEFTGYLEVLRSSRYTQEEFAALIDQLVQGVEHWGRWQGEVRLRRKDGSEFDAVLVANQVRDASGELVGAVTVIRDISQEKALQEQKDRFIAHASHELRTPLANIKTRLYLLKRQPERAVEHLAILERVADTMNELVENLLDISRFERGVIALQRQDVILQEILDEVVTIQRAEAAREEIVLVGDWPDEPLHAYLDRQRMVQVVTNLVSNAIHYTPSGGRIAVELRRDGEGRATLRVRDTGVGIEEGVLTQVFDPFFRAHETVAGGTGLGLTIAREIVHLHGGEIWVESTPGQGSTFGVRLDLLQDHR